MCRNEYGSHVLMNFWCWDKALLIEVLTSVGEYVYTMNVTVLYDQ
jgi:hypothetical protein